MPRICLVFYKGLYMSAYIPYFYLLMAIIFEVIATTALKASDTLSKPMPTVIMVIGYLTCFVFLSLVMRTMPVGIAYAIWSGLGVVLITVAAFILFGEKLDIASLAGMALIILGIVVIKAFSKTGTL